MKIKNAIWFSRHRPTIEQLREIKALGYTLRSMEFGLRLGSVTIDDNCEQVLEAIRNTAKDAEATAVFGVFPAPIMAAAFNTSQNTGLRGSVIGTELELFAAHNTCRQLEGYSRAVFSHKCWLQVGLLNL